MRRAAAALALLITLLLPGSASAATATTAKSAVLAWMNQARVDQGLTVLRPASVLADLAGYRASRMVATNTLSHSVAGNVGSQLTARHLTWYLYGEDIGYSPQSNVMSAAAELERLWQASPPHWTLMMSDRFNYVGVGFAYRASNHRWYASIVFAETADMSPARAAMSTATRSGDDVTWSWTGYDPILQTHTAGLRSFNLQVRTDWNAWRTWVTGTRSTARTGINLPGGHWYGVRVQATDNIGRTGPWSGERRVWVP